MSWKRGDTDGNESDEDKLLGDIDEKAYYEEDGDDEHASLLDGDDDDDDINESEYYNNPEGILDDHLLADSEDGHDHSEMALMSDNQLLEEPDGNEAGENLEEEVTEGGEVSCSVGGGGDGAGELIDTHVPDEEYAEFSEDPEPERSSLQPTAKIPDAYRTESSSNAQKPPNQQRFNRPQTHHQHQRHPNSRFQLRQQFYQGQPSQNLQYRQRVLRPGTFPRSGIHGFRQPVPQSLLGNAPVYHQPFPSRGSVPNSRPYHPRPYQPLHHQAMSVHHGGTLNQQQAQIPPILHRGATPHLMSRMPLSPPNTQRFQRSPINSLGQRLTETAAAALDHKAPFFSSQENPVRPLLNNWAVNNTQQPVAIPAAPLRPSFSSSASLTSCTRPLIASTSSVLVRGPVGDGTYNESTKTARRGSAESIHIEYNHGLNTDRKRQSLDSSEVPPKKALPDSDYERQLQRQAEIRENVIRSKEERRKALARAASESDHSSAMKDMVHNDTDQSLESSKMKVAPELSVRVDPLVRTERQAFYRDDEQHHQPQSSLPASSITQSSQHGNNTDSRQINTSESLPSNVDYNRTFVQQTQFGQQQGFAFGHIVNTDHRPNPTRNINVPIAAVSSSQPLGKGKPAVTIRRPFNQEDRQQQTAHGLTAQQRQRSTQSNKQPQQHHKYRQAPSQQQQPLQQQLPQQHYEIRQQPPPQQLSPQHLEYRQQPLSQQPLQQEVIRVGQQIGPQVVSYGDQPIAAVKSQMPPLEQGWTSQPSQTTFSIHPLQPITNSQPYPVATQMPVHHAIQPPPHYQPNISYQQQHKPPAPPQYQTYQSNEQYAQQLLPPGRHMEEQNLTTIPVKQHNTEQGIQIYNSTNQMPNRTKRKPQKQHPLDLLMSVDPHRADDNATARDMGYDQLGHTKYDEQEAYYEELDPSYSTEATVPQLRPKLANKKITVNSQGQIPKRIGGERSSLSERFSKQNNIASARKSLMKNQSLTTNMQQPSSAIVNKALNPQASREAARDSFKVTRTFKHILDPSQARSSVPANLIKAANIATSTQTSRAAAGLTIKAAPDSTRPTRSLVRKTVSSGGAPGSSLSRPKASSQAVDAGPSNKQSQDMMSRSQTPVPDYTTLKIVNLDLKTPAAAVKEMGQSIGEVVRCGRMKKQPKIIIIKFAKPDDAKMFKRKYHLSVINNTNIEVNFVKSKAVE